MNYSASPASARGSPIARRSPTPVGSGGIPSWTPPPVPVSPASGSPRILGPGRSNSSGPTLLRASPASPGPARTPELVRPLLPPRIPPRIRSPGSSPASTSTTGPIVCANVPAAAPPESGSSIPGADSDSVAAPPPVVAFLGPEESFPAALEVLRLQKELIADPGRVGENTNKINAIITEANDSTENGFANQVLRLLSKSDGEFFENVVKNGETRVSLPDPRYPFSELNKSPFCAVSFANPSGVSDRAMIAAIGAKSTRSGEVSFSLSPETDMARLRELMPLISCLMGFYFQNQDSDATKLGDDNDAFEDYMLRINTSKFSARLRTYNVPRSTNQVTFAKIRCKCAEHSDIPQLLEKFLPSEQFLWAPLRMMLLTPNLYGFSVAELGLNRRSELPLAMALAQFLPAYTKSIITGEEFTNLDPEARFIDGWEKIIEEVVRTGAFEGLSFSSSGMVGSSASGFIDKCAVCFGFVKNPADQVEKDERRKRVIFPCSREGCGRNSTCFHCFEEMCRTAPLQQTEGSGDDFKEVKCPICREEIRFLFPWRVQINPVPFQLAGDPHSSDSTMSLRTMQMKMLFRDAAERNRNLFGAYERRSRPDQSVGGIDNDCRGLLEQLGFYER